LGRFSLVLLVLLLSAQRSSAEIFKCTARAITTYQNFPCEFDSLGAVPPAGTVADASTAAPAAPDRHVQTTTATMPRVGMTIAEVKAIWGTPLDMTKEEYGKGNIQTWTYADSRSIRFDLKGRVTEVKW
jgi:hypothetical protein